jgi:hypothetical protein
VTAEKQKMDPEDACTEMLKEKFTLSELLEIADVLGGVSTYELLRELQQRLEDRGWTLAQVELLIDPSYPSLPSDSPEWGG